MSRLDRQLGQMLVDRRLLSKDDLEVELQRAAATTVPLAGILVAEGHVRSIDILRVVAESLEIPFHELEPGRDELRIDTTALRLLDADLAVQLEALPLSIDGAGRLVVAVADPFNFEKQAALRSVTGVEVLLALAPRGSLVGAITEAYGRLAESGDTDSGRASPTLEAAKADVRSGTAKRDWPHVNDLLELLIELDGSDLHITAGSVPQVRVNGTLLPLAGQAKLTPAMLRSMIYEILTTRQREEFEENRELDCSHPLPGKGRFRVNVFFQRDSVGAVMRAIPNEIKPLDELGMPPVVGELARLSRGLVLVTGPTGSGKSTTLASLIDLVNSTRACHVMSVEDPIEFMHHHKRAIVNQREVGSDTRSFAEALRHALRQDPDVILVGEMRDLETIATAVTASETGHLVFGTLHTQDASQTMERIVDVFPAYQQQQVRVQLAGSIQAVICQQLLPTVKNNGRVAAVEILIATPAVRNLVREAKVHQLQSVMQAGGKYGMQTMDQSLAGLVRAGTVSYEVAYERCHNPDDFETLTKKA